MQLGILLAVVATIVVSESSPHEPVSEPGLRLLLAIGGIAIVVLLARTASSMMSRSLRQEATTQQEALRKLGWFTRFKTWHMAVWLTVLCGILFIAQWPQLVRYNLRLDGLVVLVDLAVLAPIWIPWSLSWAAFYTVEGASSDRCFASQTLSTRLLCRARFVGTMARHHFGICLIPSVILLASDDLATLLFSSWETSEFRWLSFAIPLTALILFFPLLLSRIWSTVEMPDSELRQQLDHLTRQTGTPCSHFRIWNTDQRVINAAVAGTLRSLRRVFITDGMLAHMSNDDIGAIVLHELGHIRRHHLPLRMLLLAIPIPFAVAVGQLFPELAKSAAGWNTGLGFAIPWLDTLLVPLAIVTYGIVGLGWYSRKLEHDADLCVAQFGRAPALIRSLRQLSRLHRENTSRGTWLHPSTDRRIQLLQMAISSPQSARRYQRRINWISWLLVGFWICLTAIAVYGSP